MASYNGAGVSIFYVDGEDGNDSSNGDESGSAWKTIQKSFDELVAGNIVDGDEIRIMKTSNDATYYGLSGDHQTAAGKLTCTWVGREVIINGANAFGVVDGTIVEITGRYLDASTPMMEISVQTLDNVTFSHLKFDAEDVAQHCVEGITTNSNHMNWVNCQFTQATSHGVYTNNHANYWNFVNCRFDNNGDSGLEHQSSFYGAVHKCLFDNNAGDGGRLGGAAKITQCVFFNNGDDGAYVSNSASFICDCVFDDNAGDGLHVSGSGQGIVTNCMFTNNTEYGIVVGSACETRHFNSAFYGNGTDSYYTTGTVHLSMYNFLDDVTTTWGVTADFDFTHNGESSVVGAGMPTPFRWMGSTADDIGLSKWVNTESKSVF